MMQLEKRLERLDYYYRAVNSTILNKQHPVTGLIPASVAITTHGNYQDAWVRDNVNSILAVYGLALAYRRVDDVQGRRYELEHAVVKLMRGLLFCMSKQAAKVETFKFTHNALDALHAKYDTASGDTVVADDKWGHLQIDATSIFLLMLAEMTANGLQIIFTQDEVDFIQNLVFYIEQAYSFGENGAWERGSKQNTGVLELNSSSIGMVVGALRAINGLNLFGANGGPKSIIHCFADETTRCYQTLLSQLPRESNSKEIDGAVLFAIGFPAFAVRNMELYKSVRSEIIKKLRGRYGLKRFLKDGHQCVLEDNDRLHYLARELEIFKNIESEWPLFFAYLILSGQFTGESEIVDEYMGAITPLLYDSKTLKPMVGDVDAGKVDLMEVLHGNHFPLIPELFYVPRESLDKEKENPHSQVRLPNENLPLVWTNSLFYLSRLIAEGLLEPAELDPLGRRFDAMQTTPTNNIVQVVLLSEDADLKAELSVYGIETQINDEMRPVRILNPDALVEVYARLGQNEKLGLTGRPKRRLGTLSTCNLYRMQGQMYAFTPVFMDPEGYYLYADSDYMVSKLRDELAFISRNYTDPGRPTLVLPLTRSMFDFHQTDEGFGTRHRSLLELMMQLRLGKVGGVRVKVGRMSEMVPTSNIESLDFLVSDSLTVRANPLMAAQDVMCGIERKDALASDNSSGSRRNSITHTPPSLRNVSSFQKTPSMLKTPIMHSDDSISSYFDLTNTLTQPPTLYKLHGHETDDIGDVPEGLEALGISASAEDGNVNTVPETKVEPSSEEQGQQQQMLMLSIGDPSQADAAKEALHNSRNLYDQVELLQYLDSCFGLDYVIEKLNATVRELLEEVYTKAMLNRLWSPVRTAAGLLHKRIPGLGLALAELVVRRKAPSVGFGDEEVFIKKPMYAEDLEELIYEKCSVDVREISLVQEVLKGCSELVRAYPHIFDGIMFLRTNFILVALREELSRLLGISENEAAEELFSSAPSRIKSLLRTVLSGPLLVSVHPLSLVDGDAYNYTDGVEAFDGLSKLRIPLGQQQSLPDLALSKSLKIEMTSSGSDNGPVPQILINGYPITFDSSCDGIHIAMIDLVLQKITGVYTFFTGISQAESNKLAGFINRSALDGIALIVARGDWTKCLTPAVHSALESLGSRTMNHLSRRDLFCLIGHQFPLHILSIAENEAHGPNSVDGTVSISALINLAEVSSALNAANNRPSPQTNPSGAASLLIGPSRGRWLRRRKNDGTLNRVPRGFFSRVYHLLEAYDEKSGILLNGRILERDALVSDMTAEEINFAIAVERFIGTSVSDPAERQVAIAAIDVLHTILYSQDSTNDIASDVEPCPVKFADASKKDIGIYIQTAVDMFWKEWQTTHECSSLNGEGISDEKVNLMARMLFYDLPPTGKCGTIHYLVAAILELNGNGDKIAWADVCENIFSRGGYITC